MFAQILSFIHLLNKNIRTFEKESDPLRTKLQLSIFAELKFNKMNP